MLNLLVGSSASLGLLRSDCWMLLTSKESPLVMQSALSPMFGRLSDVLDRKWMATIPPIIAFVGAVVSARASSMTVLIGGGVLIGVTLPTIAIVQAIPSEVLPLKYRALANGLAFLGGAVGGL
jgi:MFS family permease